MTFLYFTIYVILITWLSWAINDSEKYGFKDGGICYERQPKRESIWYQTWIDTSFGPLSDSDLTKIKRFSKVPYMIEALRGIQSDDFLNVVIIKGTSVPVSTECVFYPPSELSMPDFIGIEKTAKALCLLGQAAISSEEAILNLKNAMDKVCRKKKNLKTDR